MSDAKRKTKIATTTHCIECDEVVRWPGRCAECRPYKIEQCSNSEWLTVFGPYESEPESSNLTTDAEEQIGREYWAVHDLPGVEIVDAKGQRSLCHGWNGAHFSWKYGQFGSFETLPESLRLALEAAIDGAANA